MACNVQLIGRNSAAQTAEARCEALSRDNTELRRETAALRKQANELGIADQVDFHLNVSFAMLQEFLGQASCGLHTMWNEHFGIGVVPR